MAVLYFGGVAGVLAFLLALATAGTARRIALLIFSGPLLALAWLLVVYFSARRTNQSADCSDCGAHFGRWLDLAAIMVVIGGNVLGWILGVLAGSAVRALTRLRNR